MWKVIFIAIAIFSFTDLWAQERPPFLPEDVESKTLKLEEFSTPGISNKSRSRGLEISWIRMGGGSIKEEKTPLSEPSSALSSIDQINLKLRAPVLLKDNLRVLAGYSYLLEQYNFEEISENQGEVFQHLNGRWLKSNQASLYINKPLNDHQYITTKFKLSYNGDYDGFVDLDDRYRVFSAAGVFGIKKSDMLEWGIGLNFTHSFRKTMAIPFFMYNRNFNEELGIEAILPASILLRWNVNDGRLLLAGADYSSRSYAINTPAASDMETLGMNHSEVRFQLRLEQRLFPWVWLGSQVGYQYNFSTDFKGPDTIFLDFEPKHTPYFKVGLFLSPKDRK